MTVVAKKVREVIAALENAGWVQVGQQGSHRQFRHPQRLGKVTVAGNRNKTLSVGTLANIRRQSGLEELR